MSQWISGFFWGFRQFLVGLVIVGAMIILLLRLSLFFINDYKIYLEDWLGDALNQVVAVDQIQADLVGFKLAVRFQGLMLGEPDDPIRLEHGVLEWGRPGVRLNLQRLHLRLTRQPDGELALHGLPLFRQSNSAFELPIQRLSLRDATLSWQDLSQQSSAVVINDFNLDVIQQSGQIQLRGWFDNALGQLRFAADMQSDFTQGESYLHWRGLPLARVLAPYLPVGDQIDAGRLQVELWQQWRDGEPVENQAYVHVDDLRWRRHAQLRQIAAKLNVQRQQEDRWRLDLMDLDWGGEQDRLGRTVLQIQPDGQGAQWDLAIEYLDVELVNQMLGQHFNLEKWRSALARVKPQGRLHDARLQINVNEQGVVETWLFNTRFSRLGVDAWDDFPEVRSVSGHVEAQPGLASIDFILEDTALHLPGLFRKPLEIEHLSSALYVMADKPNRWRIQAERVRLDTLDFESRGRFGVSLDGGKSPYLDVQAYVPEVDVTVAGDYVPVSRVSPALIAWLDTALQTGRVEQANVLLSGPLDTFPYHEIRNGAFEVLAEAHDVNMKYKPGWPVLEVAQGTLHFYQNSMEAELLAGGIYGNQATGHAHIASLVPTSSLAVEGRAHGPLQDVMTLLSEDGLKKDFGHIPDLMRFSGDADMVLSLSAPLVSGRGELSIQGQIAFDDNRLSLTRPAMTVSSIQGKLVLDQTVLSATGIQAEALNTPVRVDIQPDAGRHQIKVAGQATPSLLKQILPDLPLSRVKGTAHTGLTLTLPGLHPSTRYAGTELRVESDLRGLQIDWPAPLGKAARTARPLRLSMMPDDLTAPIRLTYDGKLAAIFSPDGRRARVNYQLDQPRLPEAGYYLQAELDTLDLAAWHAVIQSEFGQSGSNQPWFVQLVADQLDYEGLQLTGVDVLAEHGFSAKLRGQFSSDQIQGSFFYPMAVSEPLSIHLDKVDIDWQKSEGRQPLPQNTGPDPRSFPAIRLICDDLRVNDVAFGQLMLGSHKISSGLAIDTLLVAGQHLSLNVEGRWFMQDAAPTTHLTGKFHARDLGDFLHAMRFQRNVHEANTNVLFDLHWPGHPLLMRQESIAGSAHLMVGSGRLSELEPGLVKVLGLLNLEVLSRRLRLDFADLLEKGYSFDRIEGDFTIAQGNAETRNLRVAGPTSHIEIGGRIGYVERDFDSLVYVTPELDGTLLVAGVLAGGPVVGLGTLLIQQLLSDEVNDFSRFEYSVTGSWDEPELKPLTAGILSGLINSISGEESQSRTGEHQAMIESDVTAKPSLLERLWEAVQSGEVDGSFVDDPLFEEN
jgi:uncharacterized protein (TIGR02099 family)